MLPCKSIARNTSKECCHVSWLIILYLACCTNLKYFTSDCKGMPFWKGVCLLVWTTCTERMGRCSMLLHDLYMWRVEQLEDNPVHDFMILIVHETRNKICSMQKRGAEFFHWSLIVVVFTSNSAWCLEVHGHLLS